MYKTIEYITKCKLRLHSNRLKIVTIDEKPRFSSDLLRTGLACQTGSEHHWKTSVFGFHSGQSSKESTVLQKVQISWMEYLCTRYLHDILALIDKL